MEPRIARLWPPPEAAIRLAQLVTDPEHTLAQIVDLIASDPDLSRRILQLFATDSPVPPGDGPWTLSAAAQVLGKRVFSNLAVACWSSHYFGDVDEGYSLPAGGMWRHAVASGLAAQMLAAKAQPASGGAAFTAGILADLGRTVLAPLLAEQLRIAGPDIVSSEDEFVVVERRILGTDHAETGAAVAKTWNLHPLYQSAIRNHHDPERMVDDGAMTSIVHLADVIVSELGLSGGLDSLRCRADGSTAGRLRITESDIDRVKLELLDEIAGPVSMIRLSSRQSATPRIP